MDELKLKGKFEKMGVRVRVHPGPVTSLRIDVMRDGKGEYFDLETSEGQDVEILDVRPRDRHLLLMVRKMVRTNELKFKFLCGHDERHWFVAAVPGKQGAGNVQSAIEALKPAEVHAALDLKKVKPKKRNRRRNAAFVRQGEWFFLPAPWMSAVIDEKSVLRNEPLSRGDGGKPHRCERLSRTGGETVYMCERHPQGVGEAKYKAILSRNSAAKSWRWQTMQLNPEVYVCGRISHPDHATIQLGEWHRVVMNTEHRSVAKQHFRFLD